MHPVLEAGDDRAAHLRWHIDTTTSVSGTCGTDSLTLPARGIVSVLGLRLPRAGQFGRDAIAYSEEVFIRLNQRIRPLFLLSPSIAYTTHACFDFFSSPCLLVSAVRYIRLRKITLRQSVGRRLPRLVPSVLTDQPRGTCDPALSVVRVRLALPCSIARLTVT